MRVAVECSEWDSSLPVDCDVLPSRGHIIWHGCRYRVVDVVHQVVRGEGDSDQLYLRPILRVTRIWEVR